MSPNPETMEVQMQRSYHLNDEDDTEVDKENVAQGIYYGATISRIQYKNLQGSKYSELSLRRTPSGPAPSVHLREMSILRGVKL